MLLLLLMRLLQQQPRHLVRLPWQRVRLPWHLLRLELWRKWFLPPLLLLLGMWLAPNGAVDLG
tara:strand:- start:3239 stop:3427 length:189 start_codon:yes stop_codon:yes gene_type:complete